MDKIEKTIDMNAPVGRVWQALTDYRQFGQWFRVKIDKPFVAGEKSTGHNLTPGYEHVKWEAVVQKIEPEHYFSYAWHPYAVDLNIDYSKEVPTLVEFTLTPTAAGTRLMVVESGFDKIPAKRRDEALRMNDGGWTHQLQNIREYLMVANGSATVKG